MDVDSEHKVDDSDDGFALYSKSIAEEESEVVLDSDGKTTMLTVEMCAFLPGFCCPTSTGPFSSSITGARGSDSLRMTGYEKGSCE